MLAIFCRDEIFGEELKAKGHERLLTILKALISEMEEFARGDGEFVVVDDEFLYDLDKRVELMIDVLESYKEARELAVDLKELR